MTINVVKSGAFRLVHGSTFYVQNDPMGGARIAVLADRIPYVAKFVHEWKDDGTLGPAISAENEAGSLAFEREAQVEIAISDEHLLALHKQIGDYLTYRSARKAAVSSPDQQEQA